MSGDSCTSRTFYFRECPLCANDLAEAARLIFCLREVRCSVESEPPIQSHGVGCVINVQPIAAGTFFTREACEHLARTGQLPPGAMFTLIEETAPESVPALERLEADVVPCIVLIASSVSRKACRPPTNAMPSWPARSSTRIPTLIVTSGARLSLGFKMATTTIPIVTIIIDPIAMGLVASIARPGGNITGATIAAGLEITGKRMGLLAEAMPKLSALSYLVSQPFWEDPRGAAAREAAKRAGISLKAALLGSAFNEAE